VESVAEILDIIHGKEILIVDDNPDICQLVDVVLSRAGAEVYSALDGEDGMRQFQARRPDLLILDVMMPAPNGFEVCRRILEQAWLPVIFLTALGQDHEVVRGLELGAVDYITKPFSPKILVARVGAALRQATAASKLATNTILRDGHLAIDTSAQKVMVAGERVNLTPTEYRLLIYLLQNADRLVPFHEILQHVWGTEYCDSTNYVHVYVSRLRNKLEQDPRQPQYLQSEHGIGYRFVTDSLR
jgi:two-component system KDP operon response regulator KdpE